MRMKKSLVFILPGWLLGLSACSNKPETPQPQPTGTAVIANTDSLLYALSQDAGSFNWYLQNDSIRPSSPESPHSRFFRVRFNATAQAALTEAGRLPKGGVFPEGSLVVKELYDSATAPLKLLAVMYKYPGSSNQAANWVWLESLANGGQYISTTEKGAQCVSCHSSGRDYVRLFDLF